ncbi:copper chaperone PCu(A)C [Brevibacterium sp.]|uniref:copper chaperone PCu(A)C n=1 Tax=Brevibacterium sp. TaxID=1701 RepID=UPI0028113518|nr:copper chaperone PCu(A)C [Brevibacterium sp.]
MPKSRRIAVVTALCAIPLTLGLSACDSGTTNSAQPSAGTQQESKAGNVGKSDGKSGSLSLSPGWVKPAEKGSTEIYGTLQNPTNHDITVVGVDFAGADKSQIVGAQDDDIVVKSGKSFELKSGGPAIKLTGLKHSIKDGKVIHFNIITSDKKEFVASAFAEKPQSGSDKGK